MLPEAKFRDPRRCSRAIIISTILLLLAVLSTIHFYERVIVTYSKQRVRLLDSVLEGDAKPPYKYRIALPYLEHAISSNLLSDKTPLDQHRIASTALVFLFLALFNCFFFLYLSTLCSIPAAMLGVVVFHCIIPFTITGRYMDGDFVTIAFYALALFFMQSRKDLLLLPLVALATLNREQSVFIIGLYFVHVLCRRELNRRTISGMVGSLIVFLLVYLGVRWNFGFKASKYTFAFHIAQNTDAENFFQKIIPAWSKIVLPLVVFAALSVRGSDRFLKWSFIALLPYTILFFFNGKLWELGKFLPAFIIMIALCVRRLDERPTASLLKSEP